MSMPAEFIVKGFGAVWYHELIYLPIMYHLFRKVYDDDPEQVSS